MDCVRWGDSHRPSPLGWQCNCCSDLLGGRYGRFGEIYIELTNTSGKKLGGALDGVSDMTSTPGPQTLIEGCQGLVRSLATRIHHRLPPHVDLEDLIAYGQVGLAEAARDFDPARGSRFSTFAYYRIRGAVYDGLAKMSWFSSTEYKRRREEQMAGERPGREVEEDAGGTERLVDVSTPAPPAVAILREVSQMLHELIRALPEDAGNLIRATYFEGLDLQQAGQRLGISKSWASRLHAQTLQRLARDRRLSGSVLEDNALPVTLRKGD
jgi:RNA polymerase sigma factor FliA